LCVTSTPEHQPSAFENNAELQLEAHASFHLESQPAVEQLPSPPLSVQHDFSFENEPLVQSPPTSSMIQSAQPDFFPVQVGFGHQVKNSASNSKQQCHLCHKFLADKYKLKRHIEGVHEKVRNFECQICGDKFQLADQLKQHTNRIHNPNRHRITREFKCNECGQVFNSVALLKAHQETQHPKPSTSRGTGQKRKRNEAASSKPKRRRVERAKVRLRFPGGAYNSPQTLFEQLDDEGIQVPEHLRFYKFFATYDFECMFNKENLPKNTEKLSWQNRHEPLSVSCCSNIPGFTEPKCFISEGDPNQLLKQFVDYLLIISHQSYNFLLADFEQIFNEIDIKISESEGSVDSVEEDDNLNILMELLESQEPSTSVENDRGVDVMNSDNEDEESIESENEEDRAFLDDRDDIDDQDVNFYRAFNREREDSDDEERERPVETEQNGEKARKRPHPLVKLKVKLEEYLKELPVLGFNCGKYDLNATKEFLIPYLVENEAIKFVIKKMNNTMCLKTENLKFLD
ncbi:Zinc finger protein 142, partial [Exaiptasia diaphana]